RYGLVLCVGNLQRRCSRHQLGRRFGPTGVSSRERLGAAVAGLGNGSGHVYDVELRAVTKRFGSLVAVDGLNLKVRKGEFLSLLGPSGWGKTTAPRVVAGAAQPGG